MKNILITGCAGFIGSHLALHFLEKDFMVTGIDNLSRNGCMINLELLKKNKNFIFFEKDIRDFENILKVFKDKGPFDMIIHEAGQVAVTTSVINPREDFEINALGTFNILEATRLFSPDAFLQVASTNKVYGKMEDMGVIERNGRYEYENNKNGVGENYGLDFYSPYGCSKGTADQYVRDYNRIYGIKTVVLRQSCIYGTRQFGVEDQGWVAWFTIASVLGKPITIYGDGKQIRDILWIDDLVEVYQKLYENADDVAGSVFNVGGGCENTLSLLELVEYLKEYGIMKNEPTKADWRPGDQKVYVSDISKIS
ncbi:MAG: SDR family NAD(P)-dependent oxidoreductase, partial [Bacteroidales bacterium]|nr:SDR family NAD(P)-dependent oxidoreductase [Bacteroidales bacterium]